MPIVGGIVLLIQLRDAQKDRLNLAREQIHA